MNALNEKRENIANDPTTPIPIEYTFFLSDGKLDSYKNNRYYFRLPADWITSNLNEIIVGVRSCNIIKKIRKLDFTITIGKYTQKQYDDNYTFDEEDAFNFVKNDQLTYDKLFKSLGGATIHIVSWISDGQDLRVLENDIH